MKIDLSTAARVNLATFLATAACVALWLVADLYDVEALPYEEKLWSLGISVIVPIGTAGPFFYFLFNYIRRSAAERLELEKIASMDSLTSVLSRGAFTMLVKAYLDEVRNQSVPPNGSLLVVDVDHFKNINDSFGHQNGDEALKLIARTIADNVRSVDIVGRIGGEEFCVFLPEVDTNMATAVAERIRENVNRQPLVILEERAVLSVSIGGVSFDGKASFENLFACADANLYRAKHSGRNRVVFA